MRRIALFAPRRPEVKASLKRCREVEAGLDLAPLEAESLEAANPKDLAEIAERAVRLERYISEERTKSKRRSKCRLRGAYWQC